ncbi:MAG: regulatory protein TetR [Firmicutes bacterium]|nr:regulatory protein TetR [Bacillota bacterium]
MKRKNVSTQLIKEYISEALLLLMVNKNYNDISISEITKKAGVNRSTYYRNFASKEAVLKFSLENILFSYISEFKDSKYTDSKNYLNIIFCHFYRYKSQLLLIQRNGLSYLLLEVVNAYFEKTLCDQISNQKEKFRIYYHAGGIYNFLLLWMDNSMQESPPEITEIAISLFPKDYIPLLMPYIKPFRKQT